MEADRIYWEKELLSLQEEKAKAKAAGIAPTQILKHLVYKIYNLTHVQRA